MSEHSSDLPDILAKHTAWRRGRQGGVRADLSGANMVGANLSHADLSHADLSHADLSHANLVGANLTRAYLVGANLVGADLTRARGIRWGCIAPVGRGRRMVSAWAHPSLAAPVIAGGCYTGPFAMFRAKVTDAWLPWDWSEGTNEQVAQWRAECLHAADLLELAVMS